MAALSYWDSQFQFSAILPDFQDCLDRHAKLSAKYPAPDHVLSYGPDPRQRVDLHGAPDDLLPVFIHGGYWRALTAEGHRFVGAGLGPAFANVEYRLMPHVRLDAVVADARAAISVLAEALPGARFLLIGHSAGGHLAVWAGGHPAVAGIVAISGVYDLTPVPFTFLQEEVHLTEDEVARWSPVVADHPELPRVAFLTGDAETAEFQRGAELMAHRTGTSVTRVKGAHHMTVLDNLADPGAGLSRAVRAFAAGADMPAEV